MSTTGPNTLVAIFAYLADFQSPCQTIAYKPQDIMIRTGKTHYIDEFTHEIKECSDYGDDEDVTNYIHKYDFSKLFRGKEPFK